MGKAKRTRQKLHSPAVKTKGKTGENAEEMDVATDNADKVSVKRARSVAGSKATTNPFLGMKITTDLLKQNLPDFDTRSVVTSKTFKGMNLKKKDKLRLRHELWMEKVDALQTAKKNRKAKKKREQTAVVGDLSGMADALPTLELLMKQSSDAALEREKKERKPKGLAKEKQRKEQMISDIAVFQQVLNIPEFKANPAATMLEHLRNKIKQGQQMDT
ncbi:hypothetical protein V1264_012805 [Littorina saxatilis]|uniref:Ribosome biogenesis protein SLX9 n=2 Tax=Littorina saxatilis TaxID=31220 RepID=A0AAN9BXV8_9CAEN